jgi:hypothetical protein
MRMAVLIDLLGEGAEVAAFGIQPVLGDIGFDSNEQDACVLGSGGFGEFADVVSGPVVVVGVVDEDHAACSVHLGIDSLVGNRDVFLMRILLAFVTEDQDKFAGDIEARVVVVIFLLVGDAESGEYNGRVKLAR